MQGRKEFQDKMFYQVRLSELVPKNNFYCRLDSILDLGFLYKETAKYYGSEGQESIDPVVFFKICLVGYLNNIISDRRLIEYCTDSLAIRLFIGYDIDEKLPWHSTISRTRQLYGEEVFKEVFDTILTQCIEAGLVAGHTQAIDSAFVKANAGMDSLELKVPEDSLEEHLRKVRHISNMDKEKELPFRKAHNNRATLEQKTILASGNELRDINTRQKKWSKDQDQRPGAGNKGSKYTSNKTHYSPVDPDARISVKPGKARKLNYFSQLSVDSTNHVITHVQADFADQKDNQCLKSLVSNTKVNLLRNGLVMENVLADAGYSSGDNYAWLESENIKSYIPPHGTYKGGPDGFSYVENGDYWVCPQGIHVTFRIQRIEKGTLKNFYLSRRSDCKNCPIKKYCIGKSYEKKISVTAYKAEYDRNIDRLKKNKWHKKKRMSTVEPVFGTLINFLGMNRVNTRGIQQANKCMLMGATTFNLKKLLKYLKPKRISMSNSQILPKITSKFEEFNSFIHLLIFLRSMAQESLKKIIFCPYPSWRIR